VSAIQKWASELYKMIVKSKANLRQESISEKDAYQRTATCFNCGRKFENLSRAHL